VKKLLFLAIGLLLLGAVAVVLGVERFSLVGKNEDYVAEFRAKAAVAAGKEAERGDSWSLYRQSHPGEEPSSVVYRKLAIESAARVDELQITGWSFVGGAVVLVGSGILVLRIYRRRRTRSTGDAEATQVIQRI
jgi:hypothetical protein